MILHMNITQIQGRIKYVENVNAEPGRDIDTYSGQL